MSVKIDVKQLRELQQKVQTMANVNVDAFCESCAKELASRLLRKVVKRTPIGQYEKSTGKVGGTLRRGWTAQNGNTFKVHHFADTYVIEIINPVMYASYVEYGHRTADHKGWIKGQFMMTISEKELENAAPGIIEKKLKALLGECFK